MADNSTDDNSKLVDMDDLDSFEEAFFNREPEVEIVDVIDHGNGEIEEVDPDEEVDETEEDTLATEEDSEDEGDDEEEAAAESKPEPKKKNPTQLRIEQLVAEARQAERERDALVRRLEELERANRPQEVKQDPPVIQGGPDPNALDDKGEPVYALGEFDPKYITALTRYTIEVETKAAREKAAEEAKALAIRQSQEKLQSEWTAKTEEYSVENPDYQDDVQTLATAFRGLEPQYGEYLATTIMQCENGPAIMHYLSQNIGEAQKIVASGPFAATLAIGRLEAKLEKPKAKEPSATTQKKVSEAPPPPDSRVRGKGGQFAVRPDTDDLDAFEKEFYKR